MGRSKEFDKERVLHKAMLVFWEKGYEAASIPELLEAMGLSRSSLYETFVDKQTLYVEAIHYYKKNRHYKRNLLINAPSAKVGIRQYFDQHIASAFDEELPKGCLITNATIGLDSPDTQLHKLIRDGFEELEQSFFELLNKGQQNGEIDPNKDIKVLAHLLLNLNHSINVVSKVKSDKNILYNMMNTVIEML
ncbi:TetR/AcrR family transcriptional regulator [Paenibacillus aceris]|uniref:TetR/AcrR family transcriptional repressor of nem operon n=1 Tax=Paenibacillus aceris TaxID=869555 RepID=A0ABS4HS66_9BACL|nr:TetR/AcrR family transcriptional regulator [Paenibacillus aceris]MBP1960864.1 TetR/AcrR family transcriptional repressor of nem operon [Paenibacillus aceris]NHW35463.1 TetR/AcrR family transcriptional regulator [Paenibacillus aceris]